VGVSYEDSIEMEFMCFKCKQDQAGEIGVKRPTDQDIDLLMAALSQFYSEGTIKKRKIETPAPNIAVFHLNPDKTRQQSVVGYVINKSHPKPTIENGFVVHISHIDIERGYLFTEWGAYRVKRDQDFHISLNLDNSLQRPEVVEKPSVRTMV
jgi:hypothetical protein